METTLNTADGGEGSAVSAVGGEPWCPIPVPANRVEGVSYPMGVEKRYRVRVPENGLRGVRVRFGTYGQALDSGLVLRIGAAEGGAAESDREAEWRPGPDTGDPAWAEFRFEPIRRSGRRDYVFRLRRHPASGKTRLSFFQFERPQSNVLRKVEKRFFDGRAIPCARLLYDRGGGPARPVEAAESASAFHEDFIRVYPGGLVYGLDGQRRDYTDDDHRNYLNHVKFYRFAAQFAAGRDILDAGCGSGYGAEPIWRAGARGIWGCDASAHAVAFAREQYGHMASFRVDSATDLRAYANGSFDVVVCSEVLEHLAQTGEAERALEAIRRVLRRKGLAILATPNEEMLPGHGFRFRDLRDLVRRHFGPWVIFENALAPFDPAARRAWEQRLASGEVGTVVRQDLNFAETVLPPGVGGGADSAGLVKEGRAPGRERFAGIAVDTRRLHNTHSFVALCGKPE